MSRNGSGTYVLPAGQPVVTGTTISSTAHNTLANDLANALTASIAVDGQSVVTANIPFAGYKLTGLGAATVNGDAVRYEQAQSMDQAQTGVYYTTGGTSTAYTLTPTPAITSLVAGQRFNVVFNAANGATPTLAISGLAATALKVYNPAGAKVAPATGAIAANVISDVIYDGTDYVVLDPPGGSLTLGTAVATTSGSAIDYTSIPSWVKRITVMLAGVSMSNADYPMVQLGTGGTPTTSGYSCYYYFSGTSTGTSGAFIVGVPSGATANTIYGTLVLTKQTGNTWVASGNIACLNGNTSVGIVAGGVTLGGTLDMVRLLSSGAGTFDAGSVNILYE